VSGPAPAAEVGAAYDAGLSLRGCAVHFGMTRAQVERALREAGTRMRPPRRPMRPPGPVPAWKRPVSHTRREPDEHLPPADRNEVK